MRDVFTDVLVVDKFALLNAELAYQVDVVSSVGFFHLLCYVLQILAPCFVLRLVLHILLYLSYVML